MYYCQRKPKNRRNGVGLGTRLLVDSNQPCVHPGMYHFILEGKLQLRPQQQCR